MATNFGTSGLSTTPNVDSTKVLRQLLLINTNPTMNYAHFKDGVKDYYTYHYAKISSIDSDVSVGGLIGVPSMTAGGSTTLTPITCQVTQIHLKPEFYSADKIDETTANIFNRKGSNPETNAPNLLLDIVKELKGIAVSTYNEKWLWQSDSSALSKNGVLTGTIAGTALNDTDGILAQLRSNTGMKVYPSVDLNTYSDASIRQRATLLWRTMTSQNSVMGNIESNMFMSPANFSALYGAIYGQGGKIDANSINHSGDIPDNFKLPISGNKCQVVRTIGLDGRNDIVITTKDNLSITMDDSPGQNYTDLWYNKTYKAHQLDIAWKTGAKVADVSNCFISI